MKKVIILDTNSLMAVAQFGIDIFTAIDALMNVPYQLTVLDKTLDELRHIQRNNKGKDGQAAKLALNLVTAKHIPPLLTGPGKVDDHLAAFSRAGALVLTQDQELKRRLQRPYLTIRQKKSVILVP